MSEGVVHCHVGLHIDFGGCRPCHDDAGAVVVGLELADVGTERLDHVPAGLAVLHVVAIETLGEVLIESRLEWHNLL